MQTSSSVQLGSIFGDNSFIFGSIPNEEASTNCGPLATVPNCTPACPKMHVEVQEPTIRCHGESDGPQQSGPCTRVLQLQQKSNFSPKHDPRPNAILDPNIPLVDRTSPPTADHVSSKIPRKHGHRCMIDTCGKTFKRFADLKRHHRTIHEKAELFFCSDFLCPRSLRGFSRKDKRDSHVKSMHKSTPDIMTENPTLHAESLLLSESDFLPGYLEWCLINRLQ